MDTYKGALIDTRTAGERKIDYTDEEVAFSGVTPFQNKRARKLEATETNQWSTSACVFHAFLTSLEYEGIITADELKSFMAAYRKRINYPAEGSFGYDAWNKIREGVVPYADAPTKNRMTEAEANAMRLVLGDPVLKDRFNHFAITDYTRIAGYVAAGKAIPVFIYATKEEWSREYVTIRDPNLSIVDAYVRHAVTLMPARDFTEDGIQYFSVHDSAGFGGIFLRYVTLDFILKRCYDATRIEKKDAPIIIEPPMVDRTPDVPCKFGDRGEAVLALQRFLHDDGKLEAKYITGYYGALTAKAVLWYQLSRWEKFTDTIPQLLALKGEHWGRQSIATL